MTRFRPSCIAVLSGAVHMRDAAAWEGGGWECGECVGGRVRVVLAGPRRHLGRRVCVLPQLKVTGSAVTQC